MVPPCFIRINVKLAVKELSVAIASAAQPRAAGRHHQTPWRSQARRSRAQRVATYDKYALTYLGGVLLACAVIHARVGTPKLGDTP